MIDLISTHGPLSPFLIISLLVVMGVLGGWLAKQMKMPHITGNILGGILVGPACLGIIGSSQQVRSLELLSTFAMSLIAVSIGGHLSYRRIHNAIRRIVAISVCEVGASLLVVISAARMFGLDWPTSLLLGSIAPATAPATTIALVRELRCRGPFVKTLVSVVALDNIFCILLFVMMRTFVGSYFKSSDTFAIIDNALLLSAYNLLGALTLGFAAGWITKRLAGNPAFHDFSTILVVIMACTGLAGLLGLSPLLINLFLGVYLGNSSHVAERQLTTFNPLEPILYVCFFTLAGASLHFKSLQGVGLFAFIYFGARFLGKGLGAVVGGVLGKCSSRIRMHMSYSLMPQAGIAIGLLVLLEGDVRMPLDLTHAIGAIVLGAVTLNEFVGPFFTKMALMRSGEADRDRQRLVEFLEEEFILIDLKASDKWDAIHQMVDFLIRTHHVEHMSREALYATVIEREKEMSTCMGLGVAIPHGRIEKGPAIQGVLALCRKGINYDAPDGEPVKIIMLIVTPEGQEHMHLKVMASLSAIVSDEAIRTRLIAAISPEDAWEVIESKEVRDYNYFLE